MVRRCGAFDILTWKCASRHYGVHFFDKSGYVNFQVLRAWCVLYVLTWKCASHHYGVHFFDISISKIAPSMRCVVHFELEMCFAQRRASFHLSSGQLAPPPFRPSGATNHSESRRFYLFAHLHLLSSDSFSSLVFSLLLFSSLTLHTSAFPSVHIVRSLTFKIISSTN